MQRHDYSFPFRIDPASGQAAQTSYQAHVDQMIRQVLLTNRGERIDLPEFGCGLRQLLFAPDQDASSTVTSRPIGRFDRSSKKTPGPSAFWIVFIARVSRAENAGNRG